MILRYETGIATLIQFIALSLLNIANGANSVITTCRRDSSDCTSNLLASIIFFMLIVAWFGFICMLGYAAQERRSRRFALALIAAEFLVLIVATFNTKHHPDTLSLITSVTDIILALWIIFLAIRLVRSGGGRIRAQQSRRRRRPPAASSKQG